MMKIVLDTETTGLTPLSFASLSNYHRWPRMVEMAWVKIDDGRISEQDTVLIRPDGFEIPLAATRIHGIHNDWATEHGLAVTTALRRLQAIFAECDTVIAHNLNFDLGVIQSEALRASLKIDFPKRRICTATSVGNT